MGGCARGACRLCYGRARSLGSCTSRTPEIQTVASFIPLLISISRPPCMNSVTVRCPIALFAKGHGERQNSEATIFNASLNSSSNRLWSDTVRSRARFGKQMRTFLEHIHKIPLCSPSLSASAFSATSISLSFLSLPRAQWTALYSTRPLIGLLPSFCPHHPSKRGRRRSPSFRAHFRDSR